MNIVYVLPTLAKKGGAERIISEKANYFAEYFGYDITIICTYQSQNQPNSYPISQKVKLIYLDIPYSSQFKYKYPKRLWVKLYINTLLRKKLSTTIKRINPNILIGFEWTDANMVTTLNCSAKKIIECHATRFSILDDYGCRSQLSNYASRLYRMLYLKIIEKKADIIVTLTDEDKMLWKKARRVEVIPNFSNMHISRYSDCMTNRVIAVGRLEEEKGYERLISIWKQVSSNHPNWQLDIFGNGSLGNKLKDIIKNEEVRNISIHKSVDNISIEYSLSSICVVTSLYEGFSLVLLEAMRHGVPCISFDCPFGPRNIIEDNKCGYLVDNGNISLFVEKLNQLIENDNIRKDFSAKAILRAQQFSTEKVMDQWKHLFLDLTYQQ